MTEHHEFLALGQGLHPLDLLGVEGAVHVQVHGVRGVSTVEADHQPVVVIQGKVTGALLHRETLGQFLEIAVGTAVHLMVGIESKRAMLALGPADHVDVFLGMGAGVIHVAQMDGEIGQGQLHLVGHRHRRGMTVERPGAPVASDGQHHVAVHFHQRRVGGERRVVAQVLDPLEQRLAPQQVQQLPFAAAEQGAVLEYPGRQLVLALRQGRGVADLEDRQAVGQLPRHGRFVVRQVAMLDDMLGLVVASLQQLDDGLELLGLQVVDEFFPGHFQPRDQPVQADLDLVELMFPMVQ